VPIYALDGVSKTLAEIDGPKRAYWTPIYKEEYPAKTTFPDHTVKDGDVVAIDGVTFTVHDLGAGESADEAIWVMQGATKRAFVGDLVMHRVHPWLAEGRSAQWIASLAKAKTIVAGATSVYPGHGSVTDPSALDWQARYLEAYRGAVKAIANGKPALDDAQKKELTARMKEVLPDGGLEALVAMSADSVAAELQKGH
jgi:glyoxylase-like metal-dependent hydrolase (beta-lactamase superfamily II)